MVINLSIMKTEFENSLNKDDLLPHLSYFDIEYIHSNYAEEEAAHAGQSYTAEVSNEITRNFNEEDFI